MGIYETKIATKLGDKHHIVIDNFGLELVVNINNKDEYTVDVYDQKGYCTTGYFRRNEKLD